METGPKSLETMGDSKNFVNNNAKYEQLWGFVAPVLVKTRHFLRKL